MTSLKIYHCPTTVGGNPQGISAAERRCGQDSRSIALQQNYLNYSIDEVVFKSNRFSLLNEFRRWRSIVRMLKVADVIHYNFGQSMAPLRPAHRTRSPLFQCAINLYDFLYASWLEFIDVRIARKMGKVIAVTYQGDDARQGDYCRQNYPIHFAHNVDKDYYNDASDVQKRRRIDFFSHHADLIYAVNPDLLNVLPERSKFLPYASVNPRDWQYIGVPKEIKVPHIVHAPSNRDVKGTQYLINALDKISKENIPFKFTLVEGYSNNDARKIYETADILVDQLLAGYYGGLAVELMSLGKPVICYMRNSDFHYMPKEMVDDLPILSSDPSTIYQVLKEYLTDKKSDLSDIGVKSRRYAEKWHDPDIIARSLINDYNKVLVQKKMGR